MAREILEGKQQTADVTELTKEVNTLKTELAEAQRTIISMSTAIERGLTQ